MANGAAFAQGRMFVHKRSGFPLVASGTSLIEPRHGQSAFGLHDVHAVGIVAINAIHLAFQHRMMIGKMKLRLHVRMASETRLRVFAGIDDKFIEPALAGRGDVFAARPVAGLATILAGHRAIPHAQPRVRAGRENTGNFRMTIRAGRVAHIRSAFNLQWHNDGAIRGAGSKKHPGDTGSQRHGCHPQ